MPLSFVFRSGGEARGDGAGAGDDVGDLIAHGVVQEGLGGGAELLALDGDDHEGTLDGEAAVRDGLLARHDAVDRDGGDGLIDGGEGSVADGVGVGGNVADDVAGGAVLVGVGAGALDAEDFLEGAAGAGAFSSSERARLARPRSQVPPRTPSMPEPEPEPV